MSSTGPTQQSDAELDAAFALEQTSKARATTKSTRPTSTMALAFSDALNDAFLIDDQLDQLSQTINRKKQSVSYQSSELAALEARIKAAERLLEENGEVLPERKPSPPPVEEVVKVEEPVVVEKVVEAPVVEEEEEEEEDEDDDDESEEEEPLPRRRTRDGYVVVEKKRDYGRLLRHSSVVYPVRPASTQQQQGQAVSTGI